MYPIMLSDTSLGLGLAPETTCQFRTPALERPARNQTINIFIFFYFSLKTHFVTCALRETGLKLLLRSPCLYIDVSVLYISPLCSNSSSLRCYERTLAVININFISSFCAFFSLPSIFSLQGTYFSLLDPSFFGQDLIYTITRTRLDLCNFYGRSVRISARYKTPNPLCFSSPFYLLTFSLSVSSPQKYHLCKTHSLITSLSSDLSSRGFQIKL